MDSSDPQYLFATDVVRRLRASGAEAYWAGGCVRDLLRGKPPDDYDVATSATPDRVRELFGRRRTLAVGESFGVIIVLPPAGLDPVEVATFRTEGEYHDGRRPSSVAFSSARDDAQRRDFTINGMFFDPVEQNVLDFVGGQNDLKTGVIRAIGDPHVRMREDKLRLMRAVRFAAVLDFRLDPTTEAAVTEMAGQLSVVSVERIAQELRKMLHNQHRRRAVELCLATGLLDVILPGWSRAEHDVNETLRQLNELENPTFGLALAVLMRATPNPDLTHRKAVIEADTVRGHCRRLKLSNEEIDSCLWLHARQHDLQRIPGMTDAELKRLLAHPLSGELRKWFAVQAAADAARLRDLDVLSSRANHWTVAEIDPSPFVTGQDILALGLKPGPRLKELLDAVRTAQLNGDVRSVDEAMAMLRGMISG